ncbi:MAG: hypothetical protein KF760_29405 [Candidatus Eremiobacteraeota bacterium]|nr:hypothetical protein [Candidatus Eremiobacteraeota bacterium]MCW5872088.1 hypothetical protein [Candidatus Eremiobacteraeota bacterium]
MNAIAHRPTHTPVRHTGRTQRRRRQGQVGRRRRQDGVRLSRNARSQRTQRAQRAAGVSRAAHSGPVSGTQLARDAQRIARSGIAGRGRNCYRGVKYAMARQGVNLTGVPAYTAAGQLARNSNFREARVSRDQLRNLPAGATVVWAPHGKHKYGHISIALGNGREASDVLRNQITNYGSSFRVFLPNRA